MPHPYKGATCRGCYALGTACQHCEKCVEELASFAKVAWIAPFATAPVTPAPPETGINAVHQVVGELAHMEYAGDVRAVGICIIDKDGDARTLTAYNCGTRLALLGASTLLVDLIKAGIQAAEIEKKRD